MALQRLRVHQVFGADTDAGKTVFSTALALASVRAGERVAYAKPVSTGPANEMDAAHVQLYAPHVHATTLMQFSEPVSPHLAARREGGLDECAQDMRITDALRAWIRGCTPAFDAALVETAGGVHSPSPSGSSQADVMRALRLPTILVGSSVLGGISTTRAAFESLRMRGYDVDAVLLFAAPYYGNDTYLAQFFAEQGIPVFAVDTPPARTADTQQDRDAMRQYYARITGDGAVLRQAVKHLQQTHHARVGALHTLGERAHARLWWPFTQHRRVAPDDVLVVDSAHADFFQTHENAQLVPVFDGSASWWTQVVGHANPRLTLAAAYAAGRYGHVLSPSVAHAPAVTLAERLLGERTEDRLAPGRGWASRVFFSDDGSTGMEVALKMAMQACARRYEPSVMSAATHERVERGRQPASLGGRPRREWEVLGLQGSYHGDTIGAMDACEPSVYSEHVAWYRGRGYWLSPPVMRMSHGRVVVEVTASEEWERDECVAAFDSLEDAYDVPRRLHTGVADVYRRAIHKRLEQLVLVEQHRFGALVLEPLVMGAGGMVFVDPLFQRCLVDAVRAREDLFSLTDAPLRDAHMGRQPGGGSSRSGGSGGSGGWSGLPVVYDEVFTGMHRLGCAMGADVLGTPPDISCLAKILSGGLVPLSVTLASQSIYDAFAISTEKTHALLHGHSYTAYPVGCHVALETMDMLDEMRTDGTLAPHQAQWSDAIWSVWTKPFVERLSHAAGIRGVMALGTVLKLELTSADAGYASNAADAVVRKMRAADMPVHLRALGNVMYVITSLTTPPHTRAAIEAQLAHTFL